ncbi:MAG: hypothetical protein GWO23_12490, partial [Gammaproteobacteria bacterium]|nr:hypothetical protein [Gammaproteobacteria bacterium]
MWSTENTQAETSAEIAFPGLVEYGSDRNFIYTAGGDIHDEGTDTTFNATSGVRASAYMKADDNDPYIFYIDTSSDVHLISDDESAGSWDDENAQQTGTYDRVIAGWSYNNQNNTDSIDYIFEAGTTVYWDEYSFSSDVTVNCATASLTAS